MTPIDSPVTAAKPAADHIVPGDVRLAIAHMRANLDRPLAMSELVRVSGVPERTLQKHFRTFLGVAPLVHLRRMRLGAARAALLAAAPGDSVTTVAARFGFGHAGRFAVEYRARFGETPSTTLARATHAATGGVQSGATGVVQPAIWQYRPTLAILPFRTDDGRLAHRQLAELLAEQLAAAIGRTHTVAVHLGMAVPIDGARAAFHGRARYGLTGRIALTPSGRLRIVARLVDLEAGGVHLWGDAYDGDASDPLALLDCVVEGTARAVASLVQPAEIARARGKPAGRRDSRDLVLCALPLVLAADPTSAREALAVLEDAMTLDPDDPLPPALAAWCRGQFVLYETAPDPAKELAAIGLLSARAATLDPIGDPLVLTARGGVAMVLRRRSDADMLLARAMAIDPHLAWAWERSAWVNANMAEPAHALKHFERATSLKGPGSSMFNCMAGVATAHFAAGRYAEAVSWGERALAQNPRAVWFNRVLAPCHLARGDVPAATAAVNALRRDYPAMTVSRLMARLPQTDETRRCAFAGFVADGPIPDGLARLGVPF